MLLMLIFRGVLVVFRLHMKLLLLLLDQAF
jgi:hypothetical protein